jgi:hypothetical protein
MLRHGWSFARVVVASDHRELDFGTLHAVIRQAGLSASELAAVKEQFSQRIYSMARGALVVDTNRYY